MTETNRLFFPYYMKDGFIITILLAIITIFGSRHNPSFHYSALYQHLNVLGTVSFAFAFLMPFLDLFLGFTLARFEDCNNRLFVFLFNLALIIGIYFIGVHYFNFNGRVHFF